MIGALGDLQLIWSAAAWSALRPLLLGDPGWLTANVRWRRTSSGGEALVDVAQLTNVIPQSTSFPPTADYLIARVDPRPVVSGAAAALLTAVQPRNAQTAIAVVFSHSQPEQWDGAVFDRGQVTPLAEFRVAGPGMVHVARDEMPTQPPDLEGMFSRLRGAVGDNVYGKLRRATVTQIGSSRNGTLCAQMLASLGVQRLRLCDGDVLGLENLDGMPGVKRELVGRPKPEAVAETLVRQREDLAITCCNRSLLHPDARGLLAERTDLLITCVDDEAARVAAGIHAQRMLVPHLDLATSVTRRDDGAAAIFGDARLFLPEQGCCNCAPSLAPAERELVLYRLAAPHGSLERGEQTPWFEVRVGSLVTINSATVAAGVQSWLDLLAGVLRTSLWQRLDWIAGEGLQTRSGPVGAADECPFCHAFDGRTAK